ncbi:MAG: pseudouridine synthase [Candidatus Omnitrophota bacterium]
MRLQVFLSHNGICSRREAMEIIQSGRVKVNGRIQREPSTPVDGSEDISVDGKKITVQSYTYIMLHKPPGYTTTKDDPHADKTVLDLLPKELHYLSPVGRLDRDSEGLLLFTNDGDLAYRLTHPKFHLDKTYIVRVRGKLSPQNRKRLEEGVVIKGEEGQANEDEKTAPCRLEELRYNDADTEFKITIHEGRKRQIRRMLWSVGHRVHFLKRISVGPLTLKDLSVGQWRHLSGQEVSLLKKNE